jgi:Carboxypeptidase regulatory-like domain
MILARFGVCCALTAALVSVAADRLTAQTPAGASITGVVRDSAALSVPGADVSARPGSHRTRTDSAGRFTLTGLDAGKYTVVARKLGYAPVNWEVSLGNEGHVDIRLVFDRRLQLDTVTVLAGRECSRLSFDGFFCRRRGGGGAFLDYNEIDEKEPLYTADIFRDIPGFRVDVRSTRSGPERYVRSVVPSGCVSSLVDGRPAGGAMIIPRYPIDVMAIEIYAKPDSVPKEYQRYTWPGGDITRSGRCAVVVYWTTWARLTPKK